MEAVEEYRKNWRSLGRLPEKVRHLEAKFSKQLDTAYKKLGLDKEESEFLKFKNLMDGYAASNNTRKLDNEQLFVRKRIDEITREIKQLENNISFISNATEDNPLVKNVYAAVKQISDAMLSSKGKNYRRVVLIQYPRKGIYTLAFVTGISEGEVQEKTQNKVINLFVPTTPNPTSGFYLLVPEEDVIDLNMSVEDAFKLLISGGMVSSDPNSRNSYS